jgi:hypothetical protein
LVEEINVFSSDEMLFGCRDIVMRNNGGIAMMNSMEPYSSKASFLCPSQGGLLAWRSPNADKGDEKDARTRPDPEIVSSPELRMKSDATAGK